MKNSLRTPGIVAVVVVIAIAATTLLLRVQGGAAEGDAAEAALPAVSPAAAAAHGGGAPLPRTAPSRPAGTATAIHAKLEEDLERRSRMRTEHSERTRAFREQLAGRYSSEAVDPAWAPGKIKELTDISNWPDFERSDAKPSSLNIDCRSSICKLDAQFENQAQAENWIMMYTAGAGGVITNSVASRNRNEDGSMRVELIGRGR